MTTEEALAAHLAEQGIIESGRGRGELYKERWFYARIFGTRVPIFPLLGFRTGLAAHDTHHMLTGYDTSWTGESEVAAWELASGGCGRYLAYWIDRTLFFPLGLVLAPIRTLRAFRAGLGRRNLYRLRPERLLAMDLDEVQRRIGGA